MNITHSRHAEHAAATPVHERQAHRRACQDSRLDMRKVQWLQTHIRLVAGGDAGSIGRTRWRPSAMSSIAPGCSTSAA